MNPSKKHCPNLLYTSVCIVPPGYGVYFIANAACQRNKLSCFLHDLFLVTDWK